MIMAVAIFFSVSMAIAQEGAPTPRLKIDSLVHDFGVVRPGQRLSHSFSVRNEGSADLIIQSVSPG